mgnify:CR=1 FL=1
MPCRISGHRIGCSRGPMASPVIPERGESRPWHRRQGWQRCHLVVRNAQGGWSNPSFITLGGGSFGWQVGVQTADLLLVLTTDRSIEGITGGKVTLGADASVAAGPVGRQTSAATDINSLGGLFVLARERPVRRDRDRRVGHGDRQESECDLLRQAGHQDGRNLREYGATATRGAPFHRDPGPRHSYGCERCRACCDATRDLAAPAAAPAPAAAEASRSDTEPTSRTGHQDLPDGRSGIPARTAALTPEQDRPVVRAAAYPGPTSRLGGASSQALRSTRRRPSPRP